MIEKGSSSLGVFTVTTPGIYFLIWEDDIDSKTLTINLKDGENFYFPSDSKELSRQEGLVK